MKTLGVQGVCGMFVQAWECLSAACRQHFDFPSPVRKLKGHGAASRGIPGYLGFIPGKARFIKGALDFGDPWPIMTSYGWCNEKLQKIDHLKPPHETLILLDTLGPRDRCQKTRLPRPGQKRRSFKWLHYICRCTLCSWPADKETSLSSHLAARAAAPKQWTLMAEASAF